MVKKKVDARVRALIESCVATNHRSVFVLLGDKSRDQVVNLHYMLSRAQVKARPSVLWCYKKDLGFTTHRKKRMKELKRKIQAGVIDPDKSDPFELFVSATDIRYCYYSETQKVLGNTYGMLVLQDFGALTPNLLARTVETVEGGGIIVFLMRSATSLKQLYTMTMDVHARFRTAAHSHIVPRFNERFLLSLKNMTKCLMLDDALDVLPWARETLGVASAAAVVAGGGGAAAAARGGGGSDGGGSDGGEIKDLNSAAAAAASSELASLKSSLADTQPAGSLISKCVTVDQARCLLTFIEALSEKTLRSTVTLTAARGRGKSALLGLSIAAAVGYGYSNIFVTSPSPENLRTVFDFVFKGFDALGYVEHTDYEILQSANPAFNKAVVRVSVLAGDHRQVVQYISPEDAGKLGQAELLVIDEAAAIPLPLVKALLGPYLVFMASTVNGYEGTGRSLSLKLVAQLRKEAAGMSDGGAAGRAAVAGGRNSSASAAANSSASAFSSSSSSSSSTSSSSSSSSSSRILRELTLETPIRYAPADPTEAWLNKLLCLDATSVSRLGSGCPHPTSCDLYTVDRDALFSFNAVAEKFLQRLMALYVSSHYKNTPNDLQMLSDAPAHRIFCLLGPVDPRAASLPEVLCVVQVALEGAIAADTVRAALREGVRHNGDLIPWTVSQQFQDPAFGQLSGARVVRIATHPDYQGMGYGKRALAQLCDYYSGKMTSLSEGGAAATAAATATTTTDSSSHGGELAVLKPRTKLPPLLSRLSESSPPKLDYMGVSFGATPELHRFWKRAGFTPVYLRQTANDLTGEHTCIMLRPLHHKALAAGVRPGWCGVFWRDFQRRLLSLLGSAFRAFDPKLALGLLERSPAASKAEREQMVTTAAAAEGGGGGNHHDDGPLTASQLYALLTPYDLKRLHSYARNMVDYHVIVDLLPTLARLWFTGRLSVTMSPLQQAILAGAGLQLRTIDQVASSLGTSVSVSHVLGLFSQAMRRISKALTKVQEQAAAQALPDAVSGHEAGRVMEPMAQSLESAQQEAAEVAMQEVNVTGGSSSGSGGGGGGGGGGAQLDVSDFAEFAVPADVDELAGGNTIGVVGAASGSVSSVSRKRTSSSKEEGIATAVAVVETETGGSGGSTTSSRSARKAAKAAKRARRESKGSSSSTSSSKHKSKSKRKSEQRG